MEKTKKIIKLFTIILFILIILIVIYIGSMLYNKYNLKNQKIILNSINELKKEYIPVKLKFNKFENNKITFTLNFYDLDNNKIGTYKGIIEGQILFLDFKILKIKNSYLFFPDTIFSDTIAPYIGTNITYYYTKDNFPMIYFSKINTKNFNLLIKNVWDYINCNFNKTDKSSSILYEYGNTIHLIEKIEKINLDTIYYYVCHPKKGGIEIVAK